MTVFQNLLAVFLAAHLTGDFLLQTKRDIETKDQRPTLIKHGAIHAALILLLSGTWIVWLPALAVASTHVAIDFGKQRLSNGDWKAFLLDQGLHVLILLIAAMLTSVQIDLSGTAVWGGLFGGAYFQGLALFGGFIATVTAGAYFVDLAVEPFLVQIRAGRPPDADGRGFEAAERSASARLRGLRDGGKTIGQLERALIYVFVLIDQFSAIGFLIAAKSIFRFGELRDRSNRMEAEYILIGTLISFLWAIVVALLIRYLGGF